jgi:hypothetical protein
VSPLLRCRAADRLSGGFVSRNEFLNDLLGVFQRQRALTDSPEGTPLGVFSPQPLKENPYTIWMLLFFTETDVGTTVVISASLAN